MCHPNKKASEKADKENQAAEEQERRREEEETIRAHHAELEALAAAVRARMEEN